MAITYSPSQPISAGTPGAQALGWSQDSAGNISMANGTVKSPTASPSNLAGTPSTPSSASSPVAVVTSGPATQKYASISQDYNQNIAPKMQNAQATQQANNTLPVISGYNVSANPTGNQGETKATNLTSGLDYYITPQNHTSPVDALKNALSEPNPVSQNPAPSGQAVAQTPQQQAQSQTGVNPTAENASYQGQVQGATDDISQAYNSFRSTVNSIMSGAFPLTGAQQALVDATNQAFQQMNTQANLKSAALSSETGGVSDKVNATAGELLNITSQQSAAIAKLEIGFQDKNYQMVTDSYNAFKDLEKTKMDSITSLHNSVMDVYNKALEADQAQQTFNQTAIHNAATLAQSDTEFRDVHDEFGNVIGTQAWSKTTKSPVSSPILNPGQSSGGKTIPVVTLNSDGTPNADSQAAYLATLPKNIQETVKAVAEYRDSTAGMSAKTKTGIDSMAHNYNPNYDSTNFQSIQKVKNDYTSGATHKNIVSLNTSINHMADLARDFKNLPNTDISKYNSIKNWLAANVGSGDLTKVVNDLNALGGELAKTYKGTAGTDAEIANIEKGINLNSSPEQFKSFIESSMNLLGGRLGAIQEGYVDPNGVPIPGSHNLLNPSTQRLLTDFANSGYDIRVPGISYTNPVGYANANPENAQELANVRSQFPDMSPADALAQAQYNQSQGI